MKSRYIVTSIALCLFAHLAHAQQNCRDTAQGRICETEQPLIVGAIVGTDLERSLGLVTVSAGCSGTLLNRYWVLTARHCVTVRGTVSGDLKVANDVTITATWALGMTARATRIHELEPNRGVAMPSRDIILVYFKWGDLGRVNRQPLYASERQVGSLTLFSPLHLKESDVVTQYGQGFSSFATGVFGGRPPAVQGAGSGVYRSSPFSPSSISSTHYDLVMNAAGQVGAAGDSGGPTVVTVNGRGVGVAGVQSTCDPSGYVRNAPSEDWVWATGIDLCTYVSVEPMVQEIGMTIQESPECSTAAVCTLSAILEYLMSDQAPIKEPIHFLPAMINYEIQP